MTHVDDPAAQQTQHEHLEVELKFEAPENGSLPEGWPHGLHAESRETVTLEAQYFDTPARELAQQGVALRRRSGGTDAGWHLKQRVSGSAQHETTWPLSAELPQDARVKLEEFVPGCVEQLQAVAEITTERTATVLRDADGTALYEIADDRVATHNATDGIRRAWHEWEVEALTAGHEALPTLAVALEDAGALPSLADSKIARAAGTLLPQAVAREESAGVLAALQLQDLADQLQSVADPRTPELRQLAREIAQR